MKICSKCKLNLDDSNFSFSNKKQNKLSNYCRSCQKSVRKHFYQKNIEKYKKISKESKKILTPIKREFIKSLKDFPCKDCGIKYPFYVMDFDHLPEFKKEIKMANCAHHYSDKKILEECKKCDVVCSNCHRVRTWKRKNGG